MYINSIKIENLRTFKRNKIEFLHSNKSHKESDFPEPKLPNVNLLLGDNGSGKTTLLMAIALAALGPAVDKSGIFAHSFVRRVPKPKKLKNKTDPYQAVIEAEFQLHKQDIKGSKQKNPTATSRVTVERHGELEGFETEAKPYGLWEPIYSSQTDAFFFVGYGATRRVEVGENLDMGARSKKKFSRAQRIQGLFEDSYSLIPMTFWLPKLRSNNPGRYKQVINLINRLIRTEQYEFNGELEDSSYLFERKGLKVPFSALSDGYRAFLGWVGDLLYHVGQSKIRLE